MKKIAQITDLHVDDDLALSFKIDARKNFEHALSLAQSRGVTEVILTGDLGAPEAYGWVFESISSAGFDFHIALGNHDNLADFQKFDLLQPLVKTDGLYYSTAIEGIGFECIFLDSSAAEIGAAQLEWLKHQVSGSGEPLLVFLHHPILALEDSVVDRLYPLKNRDAVRQVLIDAKRDVTIFCGHYHHRNAGEMREGTLRQFLTPSTLGQVKQTGERIEPDGGYLAYREIWVADHTLHTQVVEVK